MSERKELIQFLSLYKLPPKDKKDKSPRVYTHTSISRDDLSGSFNIPMSARGKLHDLLYNISMARPRPRVCLTEKPSKLKPITVDIDFRFELERRKRQYTDKHVEGIARLYNDAIIKYVDISPEKVRCFVFEREKPRADKGNMKDGLHLMYPEIVLPTQIQHMIRNYVVSKIGPVLIGLYAKNSVDDIVDRAVVEDNNWLMYGCCKPATKPYELSRVFTMVSGEDGTNHMIGVDCKKIYPDDRALIDLLSIHKEQQTDLVYKISPDMKKVYKLAEKQRLKQNTRGVKLVKSPAEVCANRCGSKTYTSNVKEIEDVQKLVTLLSDLRADDYQQWIEVGWCLHNIDDNLLPSWIEFSRQSDKFEEGNCENEWSMMKKGNIGVGSLHRWARLDNFDGYREFVSKELEEKIRKSKSCTTTDVAVVVYEMYRHQYKCVSIKLNIWYEYLNHRWVENEHGISLISQISSRPGADVLTEYSKVLAKIHTTTYDGEDRDSGLELAGALYQVTYKLRDSGFKDKIMKELRTLGFYDSSFINELDKNTRLIGFDNGVYDLSTHQFRDGRPEDNVSWTTGYDYEEFSDDDPIIGDVYTFFEQVFPDKDLRHYMLYLLGTVLEGGNHQERFWILTGVGGNGKSKLLELLSYALGMYATKFSGSTLTGKRAAADKANPELAAAKGARLVCIDELEQGSTLNIAMMKEYTGGDKLICRPLYKAPFEYKPQFKIFLCCNHMPKVPPDDDASWRRIRVIPFLSKFVEDPDPSNKYEFKRDDFLNEKLKVWGPAFMCILINHHKEWVKNGRKLREPKCVRQATSDYRKSADMLSEFKETVLVKDLRGSVKMKDLYDSFKTWHKHNYDGDRLLTQKAFKTSMEKKFDQVYNARTGWVGWTLKEDEEYESSIPDSAPDSDSETLPFLLKSKKEKREFKRSHRTPKIEIIESDDDDDSDSDSSDSDSSGSDSDEDDTAHVALVKSMDKLHKKNQAAKSKQRKTLGKRSPKSS